MDLVFKYKDYGIFYTVRWWNANKFLRHHQGRSFRIQEGIELHHATMLEF